MTHQAILDFFLDSRVSACVHYIDLNNFLICVQIRDQWLLITVIVVVVVIFIYSWI